MPEPTFRVVLGAYQTDHRRVEETGLHDMPRVVPLARAYAALYLGNALASRITVEQDGAPETGEAWVLELTLGKDETGVVHVVEHHSPQGLFGADCLSRGGQVTGRVELTVLDPVSCPRCLAVLDAFRPRPRPRQRWARRGASVELVVLDLVAEGKEARCAVFKAGRFTGRERVIAVDHLASPRHHTFVRLERADARVPGRLAPFRYGILVSRTPVRWLAEAWDPLAAREGALWTETPTWKDRDDQRDLYVRAKEVARVVALPSVAALAAQFKATPEVVVVFPESKEE